MQADAVEMCFSSADLEQLLSLPEWTHRSIRWPNETSEVMLRGSNSYAHHQYQRTGSADRVNYIIVRFKTADDANKSYTEQYRTWTEQDGLRSLVPIDTAYMDKVTHPPFQNLEKVLGSSRFITTVSYFEGPSPFWLLHPRVPELLAFALSHAIQATLVILRHCEIHKIQTQFGSQVSREQQRALFVSLATKFIFPNVVSATDSPSVAKSSIPYPLPFVRQCENCHRRENLLQCGGCRLVFYCGQECQKKDRARHRHECRSPVFSTKTIESTDSIELT